MRAILPFVMLGCILVGAAEYRGVVREGGSGRAGVVVSDGLNCVKTDANGAFVLPGHERIRFIQVTPPAGTRTKGPHYKHVKQDVLSYDFELLPWAPTGGDTLKVVQMADTEQAGGNLSWLTDVSEYGKAVGAGIVFHTGDICYANGLKFHAEKVTSDTIGIPTFYCIGNHDLLRGDEYGEETFEALFGPPWYSVDAKHAHFVVLPVPYGDKSPKYTTSEVAAWLKNDLALKDPKKTLVVAQHLMRRRDDSTLVFGADTPTPVDLAANGLEAILYGHWHENSVMSFKNGAVAVCAAPPSKGGIDFSPANFPVYTFEKGKLAKVERRYAYIDHLAKLVSPSSIADGIRDELLVNAYDSGSPVKSVEAVFVPGGTRRALSRIGSWTWGCDFAPGAVGVAVTVTFDDGEVRTLERRFSPPVARKPVEASGRWISPYGNASRNGVADIGKAEFTLQEVWSRHAGSEMSLAAPVISDGVVYVGTMEDGEFKSCGVTALDLGTGKVKWRYGTVNGIRQSLDVCDDVVIATDYQGIVYGLDASTGKERWKRSDLGAIDSMPMTHANILDGKRYVTNSVNKLLCLDALTGKTLWENPQAEANCPQTSTAQSVVDGVIFWSRQWRTFNGYDLETGKRLWKKTDVKDQPRLYRFRGIGAIPYKPGQALLVGTDGVFILNPQTGDVIKYIKSRGNKQIGGAPMLFGDKVIYGTANEGLLCYDLESGEQAWNQPVDVAQVVTTPYTTSGKAIQSGPIRVGDLGVFGANDGFLYVFKPETGELVQKLDLGAPVLSPVSAVKGCLLVSDMAGVVHCLEPKP